jgi:hypothetical protein
MVYSSFHAYVIDIVNNIIINVSIKGALKKTHVELIKNIVRNHLKYSLSKPKQTMTREI